MNPNQNLAGAERIDVSVVLTVKNEEASLSTFLESLGSQSMSPREVILVDGGSTDGTLEIARAWSTDLPFIIMSEPGSNIAEGRNLALGRASGAIIAVTDAGTRLASTWLEEITQPFSRPLELQPDAVSGFFEAESASPFELSLGVTTLPDVDEIVTDRFLPSSRSFAFRRSLFEVGLQYPSWLDYCEDLVFDLRLKRAHARFEFRPSAGVAFRPRSSVRAHWTQYYRYARGDGKAGLFTHRHVVRYMTYFGLLPWLMRRRDGLGVVGLSIGSAIYLRKPVRRLMRRRHEVPVPEVVLAMIAIPWLRLVGDCAKMVGYPAGVWWRVRRFGPRSSWRTIADRRSVSRGSSAKE